MPQLIPHDGIRGPAGEAVLVRRSARRRRTVSITRRDGALEVAIPAAMSRRDEERWVRRMVEQLAAKESRGPRSDEALMARALELSSRHLGGRARPASVTWSSRQHTLWGSCTAAEGRIRISERVRPMPDYVRDYVLVHELAHLLEGGHGPAFWDLVGAYPHTERARAFLEGVSFADQHGAAAVADSEGGRES